MTNKDARKFSRFFLAGASECEIDKQGRILIPANLREFAKLEKEAVLVGVSNRIEIWSKDKWEEINDVDVDDMDEYCSAYGKTSEFLYSSKRKRWYD